MSTGPYVVATMNIASCSHASVWTRFDLKTGTDQVDSPRTAHISFIANGRSAICQNSYAYICMKMSIKKQLRQFVPVAADEYHDQPNLCVQNISRFPYHLAMITLGIYTNSLAIIVT
jgi:hypothetical protein